MDVFASNFVFLVFSYILFSFKSSYALTHTHILKCKSTSTQDPMGNSSAMAYCDFENPICQADEESEEDCEVPRELARLLQQEERTIQPHEEPVETVNLGTEEDKKEVKVGANLEPSVKEGLIQLLKVFAWLYEDMLGLDTDIVVLRLPTREDCPPVK